MSPDQLCCLRCPDQALSDAGQAGPITFWACPSCRRQFTLHEDGVLTERWLGSLSLVLYGVIFEKRPQERAPACVVGLRRKNLSRTLADIELELREASQPIVHILPGMRASEDDLREYLGLVAEGIRARMERNGRLRNPLAAIRRLWRRPSGRSVPPSDRPAS